MFLKYIHSKRLWYRSKHKADWCHKMRVLEKPKDIMGLNSRVAVLSRFISKTTDKCIPFFDQVKKDGISNGPRSTKSCFRTRRII